MSKTLTSIKVFEDFNDRAKKVQRIMSYKSDKSLTIPQVLENLADDYIKANATEDKVDTLSNSHLDHFTDTNNPILK
jgi:hypothetical protein